MFQTLVLEAARSSTMASVEISLKMELVEMILARDFTLEKMEKLTVTAWRDGFL